MFNDSRDQVLPFGMKDPRRYDLDPAERRVANFNRRANMGGVVRQNLLELRERGEISITDEQINFECEQAFHHRDPTIQSLICLITEILIPRYGTTQGATP